MVDTKPDPTDPTKRTPLEVGDEFDVTFIGNFVSPMGPDGAPQSFESRALDRPKDRYPFAYTIEILHDIPPDVVSGELAHVIPWYGQPGGGTQTRLSFQDPSWYRQEWQQMQTQGYARLTLTSSPTGEYEAARHGSPGHRNGNARRGATQSQLTAGQAGCAGRAV
nr:hypothetical protein [Tanacetum cinerariifolium]